MGDGLFQFAQRIVTQLEQCASVEKEQNIRIVLLQRHVAFKWSKYHADSSLILLLDFYWFLHPKTLCVKKCFKHLSACLLSLVLPSWLTGQKLTWKTFTRQILASRVGVMWTQRKHMQWMYCLKKNVTANMMVSGGGSVKSLCYALVLINVLGMDIAVVDFVRLTLLFFFFICL